MYPNKEHKVSQRIQALDQRSSRSFLVDSLKDDNEISKYKTGLRNGHLFLDLSGDASFMNFINAYHSLDFDEQSSPRPLISFALSLFWNHRDLIRKER